MDVVSSVYQPKTVPDTAQRALDSSSKNALMLVVLPVSADWTVDFANGADVLSLKLMRTIARLLVTVAAVENEPAVAVRRGAVTGDGLLDGRHGQDLEIPPRARARDLEGLPDPPPGDRDLRAGEVLG